MSEAVRVYLLRRFEPALGTADLLKLEPGADGLVLEVCSTRDRVPVVCPTGEPGDLSGTRVELGLPELSEVLGGTGASLLLYVRSPQVADSAARAVETSGATSRTRLVFDDLLHARVARSASERVGAVLRLGNPYPNVPLLTREGLVGLAMPAPALRPRVVRECASRGLEVYAWLVNDVSQALRVLRYGVELLVTSREGLRRELRQYLGELA